MKCECCGLDRKVTFRCSGCGRQVCLEEMNVQLGLCTDCIVNCFNEYYQEKVEAYAKANS